MRSRAERTFRVVGLVAIAAWIALALTPRSGGVVRASARALESELPRWTRDAMVPAVHVRVDSAPGAASGAWLSALRRGGVHVTWEDALPVLAVEAFRSRDPRGEVVVLASGTEDRAVLSDALGAIDTLGRSASVRLAAVEGVLSLRSGAAVARAAAPAIERVERKALFVAGRAGWEAKFVIAALEEAGWRVDARLFVAPGRDVVQGRATAVDTATHAAVILLDSAAAEAVRGVDGFVRAGGGVVFAGDASRARRAMALLGWRAGRREVAALGTMAGDTTWRGLSRVPLTLVADGGALALETRGDAAAVVVRRHYAGRVAAVGYDETWRWRMAGGANSVAEHRDWWSRIVSGVAASPSSASDATVTGSAPVAAVHAALGSPTSAVGSAAQSWPREAIANLLGLIALASLLAEWLLRRARGAR
jgi:hypothetical protein